MVSGPAGSSSCRARTAITATTPRSAAAITRRAGGARAGTGPARSLRRCTCSRRPRPTRSRIRRRQTRPGRDQARMKGRSAVAEIRDAQARMLAATTFDRNVVVTAGAGTGKTTLLVERLVHLIVKSPDPVPVSEIVALTFMIKAANEIKIRLQDELLKLVDKPEAAT